MHFFCYFSYYLPTAAMCSAMCCARRIHFLPNTCMCVSVCCVPTYRLLSVAPLADKIHIRIARIKIHTCKKGWMGWSGDWQTVDSECETKWHDPIHKCSHFVSIELISIFVCNFCSSTLAVGSFPAADNAKVVTTNANSTSKCRKSVSINSIVNKCEWALNSSERWTLNTTY